ncbi:hypothetical protein A6302_04338 [Methylobrevis pamukkalensis]|uniref:Uncharacterized protein n=1 Tax=Methylobrevis pamukkalensis TaxID=1439726 RepID=A0A1E3GWD4_9HYPH|nr:hypothetical protein A6302_04338 [Methylobrevis pamukkalensis]
MDEAIPARLLDRLAGRKAADHQPVARARQADIEQAPVFLQRRQPLGLDRGLHGGRLPAGAHPDRRTAVAGRPAGRGRRVCVRGQPDDVGPVGGVDRTAALVDEEHHRRLQPLGAVHGHDPRLVAPGVHLALDLVLAGRRKGEEAFETRGLALHIGKRQREELVEHVVHLGAEPGAEGTAPAVGGENPGKEGVRVDHVGPRPPAGDPLVREAAGGIRRGRLAQALVQEAAPAMGEREQGVLADPDQRRFQQGGKGQVVLRQQHDPGEREKVHHRDVAHQLQPVGAGDRNAGLAEGAGHGVDEAAALAHQHENVAGADRPAVGEPLAGIQPAAHGGGDPAGEQAGGVEAARLVDRVVPVFGFRRHRDRDLRPDLDKARLAGAHRLVHRAAAVRRQAVVGMRRGEHKIHRLHHLGRGAEGEMQRHVGIAGAGRLGAAADIGAHGAEQMRRGALEGVDRLLLVAHGEQGSAVPLVSSFAGKVFAGERRNHVPGLRTGVLRLVDQQVVDALVELVLHPGRRIRARQQPGGTVDEVVEVERAGGGLAGLEAFDHPGGEPSKRLGPLEGDERRAPFLQPVQPGDLRGKALFQIGQVGAHPLGAEARGGAGDQPAAVLAQEHVAPGAGSLGRVGREPHRVEASGKVEIGRLAGSKLRPQPGKIGAVEHRAFQRFRVDPGEAVTGAGAEPVGKVAQRLRKTAKAFQPAGECLAPGGERRQRRSDRLVADFRQQPGLRPADEALRRPGRFHDRRVDGGLKAGGAVAFVEHGEAAGNAGFQRKALQQRLAEAVDGLDLEPAGGLQCPGEQPARARQRLGRRGSALQRGDLGGKRRIVQHGPTAQHLGDAVGHFGGRRLGEGEAEHRAGIGPGEQQPDHPARQHIGLARAGVGRHPDRAARMGGDALVAAGRLRNGEAARGAAHAGASSSPSPDCHSRTRAR